MTAISVITPLHAPGNAYIREAYESLKEQGCKVWEWLVIENNGGHFPRDIQDDRIRIIQAESDSIGTLKRIGSYAASSPFVLELDADDLLTPDALAKVLSAFGRDSYDFVYSDCAQFNESGDWFTPYWVGYGWEHYETQVRGKRASVMKTPPVTAQNLRYIYFCPNHLRAWRKSTYERVNGHSSMPVIDDHDLMVRLYLAGARFRHIPEPLYYYRVHEQNTVKTRNPEIQAATQGVYNRYIWRLAEHDAKERAKLLIDLCGGFNSASGYINLDRIHGADIVCDLEGEWPLEASSVGVLRACDAIEHLKNPIHTMNEAWRVLAPGGWFMIDVPSSNGKGAFCDPTHVSFWNDLSFRYYSDPEFARYIPAFRGRFQVLRVIEWFPNEWHKANNVPYVQAHLCALKPGYEPMGSAWRDAPYV